MKILVGQHELKIDKKDKVNQNEYKVTKCEFEFDEAITNDLVKIALFTNSAGTYKQYIINNECDIPAEILEKQETTTLGVYAYKEENEELELRYSPEEIKFYVSNGSYKENAENTEPITPTDKEQMEQALQNGLNDINNKIDEVIDIVDGKIVEIDEAIENAERLDVDANKVGKITSITITKQDGTTKTVTLEDGQDGISLEDIEIDNRDLYVTYGGETENLGQVAPNIQVGTTTTGSPSSQARVENVGTDLNPILNFYIPKGEAGSIKFEIVEQLPTQDIDPSTIYLVPYAVITVEQLPSTGNPNTIYIVSSTNKRYVYESNQWIEITSDNKYAEYLYINNEWEQIGGITVDIDLSDYYTKTETNTLLSGKVGFTDYASNSTGGVIKTDGLYGTGIGNGKLQATIKTYEQYNNPSYMSSYGFISKGTLENVITGKGLVSNTDYATTDTGGVVKVGALSRGYSIDTNGILEARILSYTQYQNNLYTNGFIGKGTLDNVLTAKIGDIQTLLDNLNTGSGV